MRIAVHSEYEPLKAVMVHQPGTEIERLTRDNRERLLFEDFPYLEEMQREHKEFISLLESETCAEVLYFEKLLTEVLQDHDIRVDTIRDVARLERCEGLEPELLEVEPAESLARLLLAGISAREARANFHFGDISDFLDDYSIIPAAPNAYFMRDPAAVIGEGVLFSKMHYAARMREALLVEVVFRNHPKLAPDLAVVFGDGPEEMRPYTIEGGDVLVLNKEAVAVGCSERTRSESIQKLARNLFRRQEFERVYEVEIPFKRDYMHLDTVFTIVGPQKVVAYPDAVRRVIETKVYEPRETVTGTVAYPRIERRPFLEVLQDELGKYDVIETGGGDPRFASREQIGDGTNVFAIAPDKVITYARNKHTNEELRRNGVEVLEVRGSELVRGRGGPRCMTMPLVREAQYEQ